ncbi:glycosyltransferase involved in cell wall biosynthesis [Pseudomonas sp. GV105]|nr:glycosyltransferase involved in cell wall biosynthesis [Pseudomonas sp. GV105]
MKILLLSKYSRMGASSRLRALQFLPFLEKEGLTVEVNTLFDDRYLERLYKHGGRSFLPTLKCYFSRFLFLFTVRSYDVVWIEKEIFPFFPAFAERLLKFFRVPYVVDYDDAIFHNYNLSGSLLVRKLLGSKIDVVMRHAEVVVAGNSYLAEYAIKAGALKVEIIPTVVDHSRYDGGELPHHDKLVIGWIGSPSTEKYVVKIKTALMAVCENYGARVVLMGASPGVIAELDGLNVEVLPWSEDSETAFIKQLDIGIMPLVDGFWEKGKCGYKLIQYMACGVPVVASPVGVNVDIVDGNECGMLAADIEDWRRCLDKLLNDRALRVFYGGKGLRAVENTFSLQVQAPRIRDIFMHARK